MTEIVVILLAALCAGGLAYHALCVSNYRLSKRSGLLLRASWATTAAGAMCFVLLPFFWDGDLVIAGAMLLLAGSAGRAWSETRRRRRRIEARTTCS